MNTSTPTDVTPWWSTNVYDRTAKRRNLVVGQRLADGTFVPRSA